MASRFDWKIYNDCNEYVAQTVFAEDAAVLVAAMGAKSTVRCSYSRKTIVWTEGETGNAGESYDAAAETMRANATKIQHDAYRAAHGEEALQRVLAAKRAVGQ